MSNPFDKLNRKLGNTAPKQGKSGYRHEREATILSELRAVMQNSPMAQSLLQFADDNKIEIHVLRHKTGFGFVPESSHVYIAAAPEDKSGSAEMIIHLTAALREAQQEFEPDMKRPDISHGKEAFTKRFVDKKSDIRWHQCAVVDELASNLNFTEIIDSFKAMGYSSLLEGYRKDLQENG